ncbi:retrovirus-related pol polyprotein from transposon TNT 1-94 [Tanacetum coccineum]
MQIVTLLKNDFKKEEYRNIDRKIALDKKIKQLDNIVYKRDQSAQTVHMLTKPQFFYDHTTKQALGFQIPFYMKKAQQLKPKLYDGNVIKNTSAIVIPDSEETLMLAGESHFEKRFIPQTELSAEQAFWSQNSMNSSDPNPSCRPTKVEVPKELPKVSMINTSLKKLKHYLAGFDVVVKERTTTTTITEGSWGAVKQHRLVSKTFEVKMNQVLNENERLLEQVINKDIMKLIINSSVDNAYVNVHECEKCLKLETELLNKKDFIEKETYDKLFRNNSVSNQSAPSFDQYFELNELKAQSQEKDTVIKKLKERIKSLNGNMNKDKDKKDIEEIETLNIELDHRVSKLIAENEHLKQTYKQLYDSIKPTRIRSKEQCDALEKDLVITTLKNELRKLKGKDLADTVVTKCPITLELLKIDVEPKAPRLLNNRTAHADHLRHTHEQAAILREIVEQGKLQNPLNNSLDSALGNACPLTRITTTAKVPFRKPTALESDTPKPVVTMVYSRKPRKSKTNVPVSKLKIIKSISANKKEPSKSWGSIVFDVPYSSLDECRSSKLFSVKFGNDHVAKILGYGDYQIKNVMISKVYYLEGLGHNLFSVGQLCDSNLEVAFRQHTCFIRNLEARHGLIRGLPKLKFEKDHLCSACTMGKRKKKPHKPKSKDTNQEKLYLLHMDLCRPMCVASVNGKKYILVIVDDYSRFTWVKCLRSKDKAPDFIIKFLKMIQVRLKVPDTRIKTDNGTEFVNQTLHEYYEKVGISHETSVARSPQQNGFVERLATSCYTQNHSIIRLRHGKTPYELLHDKLPDLLFFHVFGALCYLTNDIENLGKLQPKANIGIFIGYAPTKKAFRIYNLRTRRIIETIHVDFDELTAMASEHSSLEPALHEITPVTISSGLVPNTPPSTTFVPPSRTTV